MSGPCASVGEPSFIPRSADAPEGDGFVICCKPVQHSNLAHKQSADAYIMPVINRFDTALSDLVVLDTKDFQPVAMVKLPLRVRAGLHGNFVEHSTMSEPDRELVDYEWVPARVRTN